MSDLSPEMREAVDTARAIITATAEGMAIGDPRLADNLVQQIKAELAALDDRAAAAHRAGNIIHACARLAVFVAQLPSVIFDELERDGVQVPAGALELFGNPQSALSSAFIIVADLEAEE